MTTARPATAGFLHALPRGWLASDPSVGGPNYDEFVSTSDVEQALARRPDSVVAVDLPQHTPEATAEGLDFRASLPIAVQRLAAMKAAGRYTPLQDRLVAYELREASGHRVRALVGLVRPEEFSSAPGEPGRIVRNEDVFAAKVEERTQHISALGHLLSAVLLLPARDQDTYDELLDTVFGGLGDPAVVDVDDRGTAHAMWPLDPAAAGAALPSYLAGNEFLVADGNHRSLASQLAGSPWCLVVVASPTRLRIEPYNRLLRLPDLPADELVRRVQAAGVGLAPTDAERADDVLLTPAGAWRMDLEAGALPHEVVERRIFRDALGLDPGDPRIGYVGGADQVPLLRRQVADGSASAALLLRPVTVPEFTAVNAARERMPRKSTWFMPKARAGLVLAELGTGSTG